MNENYSEDLNLCLYYQATRDEKAYEKLLKKYTPLIYKKALSLSGRGIIEALSQFMR